MSVYKSSTESSPLFSPKVKRQFGENWFIPRVGLVIVFPMPEGAEELIKTGELVLLCTCGIFKGDTHLDDCPARITND